MPIPSLGQLGDARPGRQAPGRRMASRSCGHRMEQVQDSAPSSCSANTACRSSCSASVSIRDHSVRSSLEACPYSESMLEPFLITWVSCQQHALLPEAHTQADLSTLAEYPRVARL